LLFLIGDFVVFCTVGGSVSFSLDGGTNDVTMVTCFNPSFSSGVEISKFLLSESTYPGDAL
jgi:hypothetical protein